MSQTNLMPIELRDDDNFSDFKCNKTEIPYRCAFKNLRKDQSIIQDNQPKTNNALHMLCNNASCLNIGTKCCGRCHGVSYCSVECQKEHWSAHKHDCKKTFTANFELDTGEKPRITEQSKRPRDWKWSWSPDDESIWGRRIIEKFGCLTLLDRQLHQFLLNQNRGVMKPILRSDEFQAAMRRRLQIDSALPHAS